MERELYIAIRPLTDKYAEVAILDNEEIDDNVADLCPLCGRRVSGSYWMRPREVVLTSRRVPDFLYCYGGSKPPFLISERALTVIRQEGLTGIKDAQEIEYVRFQRKAKKEVPIPKYYYLELERSRMTINHEKSSIVYGSCPEGDPSRFRNMEEAPAFAAKTGASCKIRHYCFSIAVRACCTSRF